MAQPHYRITLLPGDGIGPEIITVAVEVLKVVGEQLDLGLGISVSPNRGAAIDTTGEPRCYPGHVPQQRCHMLAAIGGYKWTPCHATRKWTAGIKSGAGLLPTSDQRKYYPS